MANQDPKPSATATAVPSGDKLPKDFIDLLANSYSKNLFGDDGPNKEAQLASQQNALATAREQEKHGLTMALEAEKMKSQQLKNQQAEQTLEINLAKAQAQGLAANIQDPKPPAITPEQLIAGTINPANGQQNVSKFLLDSIKGAQAERNALKGVTANSPEMSDLAKKQNWILDEITKRMSKLDNEKHLSRSPLGQAGSFLGGVLDIVSGPLDVGTSIFGGTMTEEAKMDAMSRVFSYIGPQVRAELEDSRMRDRMDISAENALIRRGLGATTGLLRNSNDSETADEIMKLSIDIQTDLQNDAKTNAHFSSESVTGIGDAFNVYQDIEVLLHALKEARTDEEFNLIERKIVEADTRMRVPIQEYLAAGGTPETIKQAIIDAKNVINEKHQQPLTVIPGDSYGTKLAVRRGVVAKSFTDKLTDFYSAIVDNTELDMQAAEKIVLGEKKYAAKQKYSNLVSGTITDPGNIRSSVPAGMPGSYNPGSRRKISWKDIDSVVEAAKTGDSSSLKAMLESMSMSAEEFTKFKLLILDEIPSKEKKMAVRESLINFENSRFKAKK